EELVHRALLNSPDVEAAYWRWRAAIETIPQRGTEMTVPMLGATVGVKNGVTSNANTMLELANMSSTPIEWPGKPLAEARAALQKAYAAGWNYRRAQFAVRRQTLDAWYKLVADSAMLSLLHRDAALVRELDEFAQAGIQAGTSSPSTALSIENKLTGLHARIAAVSSQLSADLATLNRILGRPVQRPLRVPPELPGLLRPDGTVTQVLT
ncbi:chemiosmotic efflux system B protein C, partial [mine drainage metagenome]